MARKFLTPVNPPALSSDPASGTTGAIYFNTQINKLKVYNGTAWIDLSQSNDLSTLSIQQVNTGGSAVESYNNISTIQFDEDSGFDVTNPSAGIAKVAMNSTFKYWQVDGVQKLTATGLDTVNLISGSNISITGNGTSSPQSITIATGSNVTTNSGSQTLTNKTISGNSNTISIKANTASGWASSDPVLATGELGIETDTLKIKLGSGTTWTLNPNYVNVVPSDLNSTLSDYLLAADLGTASGPAQLDASQNLLIPSTSIIFEGATADSYETTLTVTDPTADRTITIPNVDGTIITTGDTATVTNAMLAGSIANNKLSNSSITIGSTAVSLGSTITTLPGVTSINGATVPSSGTLATLAGAESLSSKTLNQTSSATVSTNSATTIDTTALASFTTLKYVLSIKQGSKIRSSELLVQTDGSTIDYSEYGIIETGGVMNAISVVPTVSGSNCVINITIANAATTAAAVKMFKVLM